jgi:hypothetical protein
MRVHFLTCLLAVVIAAGVLGAGCTSSKIVPRLQYAPEGSAKKHVTILYHETPFKRELVDGVAKVLRTRGVSVVTDDLKYKDQYPPSRSDLVVLVVSVQMMRADKKAVQYIKSHQKAGNILVVSTSGRGSLSGLELYDEFSAPDCVTGASTMDAAGAFCERITQAIERKLEQQNRAKTNL